jgi:hypothetical protein
MPQAEQIPTEKMGIVVSGLCMAKNSFPTDQGTRYSLEVAVPGQKIMVSLSVKEEEFKNQVLMAPIKKKVNFTVYKGNVYFNEYE